MKHSHKIKLIQSMLLLLILLPCQTVTAMKTLKVGVINFPPFVYEEQGQLKGPIYEALIKSVEKAGFKPVVEIFPVRRLMGNFSNGISDLAVLLKEGPHTEHVIFSQKPVTKVRLNMYKIEPKIKFPEGFPNFTNKQLIVMLGYDYGGLIYYLNNEKSNNILSEALTVHAALQMLQSGRSNFYLNYEGPVKEYLKKNPVSNIESKTLQDSKGWFVLSKSKPNAREIMDKIETAFENLKQEQAFSKEYLDYFNM